MKRIVVLGSTGSIGTNCLEVIASLPADASRRPRKPRVYPAAVIPFGHGLAALATFVMAVVTAIGTH